MARKEHTALLTFVKFTSINIDGSLGYVKRDLLKC